MTMVSKILNIFNLQDMSGTEAAKNKAAYTREGRRQLFALLQGARGSTGNFPFPVVIFMYTLMGPLWKCEHWFSQEKITQHTCYLCNTSDFNPWFTCRIILNVYFGKK